MTGLRETVSRRDLFIQEKGKKRFSAHWFQFLPLPLISPFLALCGHFCVVCPLFSPAEASPQPSQIFSPHLSRGIPSLCLAPRPQHSDRNNWCWDEGNQRGATVRWCSRHDGVCGKLLFPPSLSDEVRGRLCCYPAHQVTHPRSLFGLCLCFGGRVLVCNPG